MKIYVIFFITLSQFSCTSNKVENIVSDHLDLEKDRWIARVNWGIVKPYFIQKINNAQKINFKIDTFEDSKSIKVTVPNTETNIDLFEAEILDHNSFESFDSISAKGSIYKDKWKILNENGIVGFEAVKEIKDDTTSIVYLPYEILIGINKLRKIESPK